MEEFALCWNNFQDNIATGFQNLLDRGDLVDVTIAVENRLIQAHKIVLAICSPYFQEMFQQNPCKHPIIILKDVSYSVMSELLQFMYQGEVNVKHIELPTFMKIAETLQIKGLTTPSSQKSVSSPGMHHPSSSSSHLHRRATSPMQQHQQQQHIPNKNINSSDSNLSSPPPSQQQQQQSYTNNQSSKLETPGSSGGNQKRGATDYITSTPNNNDSYAGYTKVKVPKRSVGSSDVTENSNGPDMNNDSMDNMTDEVFMPPIPQISMSEGRFDLNNVKRENPENANSPAPRHSNPYYEYNNAPSGASSSSGYTPNKDYANDMHDFANKGHHMEIPAGINNITMLSSTSLLHGNCIFNRNNTVATQQGMKTYWLCKSYRITMCRARCITHQGRVISATGVHNHAPHMKNGPGPDNSDPNQPPPQPIVITSSVAPPNHSTNSIVSSQSLRIVSTSHPQQQQGPPMSHPQHPQQGLLPGGPMNQSPPPHSTLQSQSHHLPISAVPMGPTQHMHHLPPQGMPPGMLNTNQYLSGPMLNPQHHLLSNIHPPPSLQITPVINSHLNNGVRMSLPPPPPQNHLIQSMHESPSPSHAQSLIQQPPPPPQQNQNEDSQTTMSDGHQESMMQMEMTSQQQQQQLTNQNNYKMEHGM